MSVRVKKRTPHPGAVCVPQSWALCRARACRVSRRGHLTYRKSGVIFETHTGAQEVLHLPAADLASQ